MNSYLLNRSQGSINPLELYTAQCARLIHSLAPAPGLRFAGSPGTEAPANLPDNGEEDVPPGLYQDGIWAHKSGVNVLAIDQYERR